ncbi:unnamed protein product [Rangifer tarandus platyrhynchus]|uniref:Uncharacterized protein n=1 Tax=Rangifer tarandus platyrhynchus TaxID=3082113 RepID=A0AC59ZW60_RANTA
MISPSRGGSPGDARLKSGVLGTRGSSMIQGWSWGAGSSPTAYAQGSGNPPFAPAESGPPQAGLMSAGPPASPAPPPTLGALGGVGGLSPEQAEETG